MIETKTIDSFHWNYIFVIWNKFRITEVIRIKEFYCDILSQNIMVLFYKANIIKISKNM